MAQNINVTVDGDVVGFDQPPIERFGTVLVPLRGVFERLGATVMYDVATRTIMATQGATTVSLKIGDTQATVNGQQQTLSQPAQVVNGSTLVPLRFVSEALGADVRWVAANRTVIISTMGVANVPQPTTPQPAQPSRALEITSLTHSGDGRLRAGEVITITMEGSAGARARFSIPGIDTARNLPMREQEPGTYVGAFTMPRGVDVTGATIVGSLTRTGSNGRTVTQRMETPIAISAGAPDLPVILWPTAGRSVGNAVTIRGKAEPNATVRYHITYRGGLQGRAVRGNIIQGEVDADNRGNWRVDGLALNVPQGLRNLIYTLEVESVNTAGELSETASVEFVR